jgi:2'-5' RNA ligase
MILFVAHTIALSTATKLIHYTQEHYPNNTCDWHPPKKIHLTLNYIGRVNPELLPTIKSNLSAQLQSTEAFTVTITHLDFLTKNTLVAFTNQPDPLLTLHNKIQTTLRPFKLSNEQYEFKPHITIAKKHINPTRKPLLVTNLTIPLSRIVLFESSLEHDEYTLHQEIILQKN